MRRRSSLIWLTWRLLTLTWRRWVPVVAIAATTLTVGGLFAKSCSVVNVATFNIEDFPKSNRQAAGAFKEIQGTGAEIVMVQEITRPEVFAREAKSRLGSSWEFAWARGGNDHKVGVLYDGRRFRKKTQREHKSVAVYPGGKPALELILEDRSSGEKISAISVHFKAGDSGKDRAIRGLQFAALGTVIHRAKKQTGAVVIGGDFNATSDGDHVALASLAVAADLDWPTASLPCTAYWKSDNVCRTSQLDHILNTGVGSGAAMYGACATEGCSEGRSCPTWTKAVSDHCPVGSRVTMPH